MEDDMRAIIRMILPAGLIAMATFACQSDGGDKPVEPSADKPTPAATPGESAAAKSNPVVVIETSKGTIEVELYPEAAPKTVENFLRYVEDGFYTDTVFHRVIPTFMIQGGGFTADLARKPTRAPIPLEADNGLSNVRGTIAMARTSIPDSATSQFFINVEDNRRGLDPSPGNPGYTVFGKVISGMDVVDEIKVVPTDTIGGMQNVPVEAVVIREAHVKKNA
jgi:cyclophilin family peptidyl-prolyl cis-trans isomerase